MCKNFATLLFLCHFIACGYLTMWRRFRALWATCGSVLWYTSVRWVAVAAASILGSVALAPRSCLNLTLRSPVRLAAALPLLLPSAQGCSAVASNAITDATLLAAALTGLVVGLVRRRMGIGCRCAGLAALTLMQVLAKIGLLIVTPVAIGHALFLLVGRILDASPRG